jgi:site-specific recombinase XerD
MPQAQLHEVQATLFDEAGHDAVLVAPEQRAVDMPRRWQEQPELAFRAWKQSHRAHRKEFASHSVEQYEAMFGAYLRWLGERGGDLSTATPAHVDEFIACKGGRNGKPAAATTRRRYLQLLHHVYEYLRLIEMRSDNPAAPLIDLSRHQAFEKPAPTLLPFSLADRYVQWSSEQPSTDHWIEARNKALRLVFIGSGITVKEAQMLSIDSVQIDGHVVALEVPAHGFVQPRLVPVANYAVGPLQAWIAELRRIALDCPRLFPARHFGFGCDAPEHQPLSTVECFLVIQQAMQAIGYDRRRQGPQTLRNTFIARQIWEGRQVDRIMQWAGLNSPDTVQRIAKLVPVRADGEAPA